MQGGEGATVPKGPHFGDDLLQLGGVPVIIIDRLKTGGAAGGIIRLGLDFKMELFFHRSFRSKATVHGEGIGSFQLADRISVIHWGQVIAEGTPGELQANKWVQRSALGELD